MTCFWTEFGRGSARSPAGLSLSVPFVVVILVDKDRDKDQDKDDKRRRSGQRLRQRAEPYSPPLVCGAARTPLPYLARSAFPETDGDRCGREAIGAARASRPRPRRRPRPRSTDPVACSISPFGRSLFDRTRRPYSSAGVALPVYEYGRRVRSTMMRVAWEGSREPGIGKRDGRWRNRCRSPTLSDKDYDKDYDNDCDKDDNRQRSTDPAACSVKPFGRSLSSPVIVGRGCAFGLRVRATSTVYDYSRRWGGRASRLFPCSNSNYDSRYRDPNRDRDRNRRESKEFDPDSDSDFDFDCTDVP